VNIPNPAGTPVRYGDSLELNNVNLGISASPCGTLDDPSGSIPVTLAGPVQFVISSSSGGSSGSTVKFGDSVRLSVQGKFVVFRTNQMNESQQILFIDVANASSVADGTWIISGTNNTGNVLNYGNNFNLINVGFPNVLMAACITTDCLKVNPSTCGNLILGSTTTTRGTTWEFL